MPRLSSDSAAARPPIPPPMITTLSCTRPSRLFGLHTGRFDNIGPARCFLGDKFCEILWRADFGVKAELGHGSAHLVGAQRLVDCSVELADDVRWRAGGGQRSRPCIQR